MSEEEIIKIIKYMLENKNTDVNVIINYDAIQGLLDLYNNEKEKEKNLLKELKDSEKELLEVTQNIREKSMNYVKLKDGTIWKVVSVNDFRPPECKYALESVNGVELIFVGDDVIENVINQDSIKTSPSLYCMYSENSPENAFLKGLKEGLKGE